MPFVAAVAAASCLSVQAHARPDALVAARNGDGNDIALVIASEIGGPKGGKPVCWRLLTNREITCLAEAVELIEWYRTRWEVEIFFHVLKTGCRVEALQLASMPRIERALALFMVVS